MLKGEWFYVLGADDYIENPDVMDVIIEEENEKNTVNYYSCYNRKTKWC